VSAAGGAGLRPTGGSSDVDVVEIIRTVQAEVLPYDKNYLRHGDVLRTALEELDGAWLSVRSGLRAEGAAVVPARQAAAMVAHARWMYTSALVRNESRGMAKRLDRPDLDPAQHHRITSGGLDEVWARPEGALT
jgi:succinate dehydrogenase/fumarate reductase flavoprotein subunit